MFRLNISSTPIPSERSIKNLIKKTTQTIAASFSSEWKNEAIKQLKGSAGSYVDGIEETQEGDTVSVGLDGNLPNMIEEGSQPYDMKPFFARSPKRKMKKDGGWYMDIPFKKSTVPPSILRTLESLPLVKQVQDGLATAQLKRKDLATYHRRRTVREELINTATGQLFPAYTRKNPIFEGVRRVVGQGGQHFETFRRVSDNSAPHSWIHPGFRGKGGIANKALIKLNAQMIVDRIMGEYLKNL